MNEVPPLPPGFQLEDTGGPPPLPPGFQLEPPVSTAADIAKSGGIGLAKGAIGLAGLPGDLGKLQDKLTAWIASRLGEDPAKTAAFLERSASSPFALPTSGDIQGTIEKATGKFYEPQTTAGHFAENIGAFAPAAIGGPETLAARFATRAAIPAVASEAAGQATVGTAAEPYARFGAALGAGGLSAIRRTPQAAEGPSLDAIQAARNADYEAVKNMGVTVKPEAIQRTTNGIAGELAVDGLDATMAPKTMAVLERLASRTEPTTITEIDNSRKVLGQIAKGVSSPSSAERIEAGAARRAIAGIDEALSSLVATDLATGAANHAAAIERLTSARANAATAFKVQALDRAAYIAENNAAAANSGMNVENALRQQLKAILNSPSRSSQFSAEERAQMQRIVRGEGVRNTIRTAGNLMGGGGGLGALAAGTVGHLAVPGLGIATPLAGYALKRMGNAATERAMVQLQNTIRANSPVGRAAPVPIAPPRPDPRIAALMAALVAHPRPEDSGLLASLSR